VAIAAATLDYPFWDAEVKRPPWASKIWFYALSTHERQGGAKMIRKDFIIDKA
jgi:hypothetical protein